MNVSPISYNSNVNMMSNTTKKIIKPNKPSFSPIHTAAGIGTIAGIGAFGIGLGIDRACSYMFGFSKNIKSSLIVNALVAGAIGLYTYTQAKAAERDIQNS